MQSMFDQARSVLRKFLTLALVCLATPALAEVQCSNAERSTWMDESDFRQQMKSQGVKITKFLITPGNCYEIYGFDKTGKRVETYYSPVDASTVAEMVTAVAVKP
jgi:hypothetical protein